MMALLRLKTDMPKEVFPSNCWQGARSATTDAEGKRGQGARAGARGGQEGRGNWGRGHPWGVMESKRKPEEKVDGKEWERESVEKEKCKISLGESSWKCKGGCRGASGEKKHREGSSPKPKRRMFRENRH